MGYMGLRDLTKDTVISTSAWSQGGVSALGPSRREKSWSCRGTCDTCITYNGLNQHHSHLKKKSTLTRIQTLKHKELGNVQAVSLSDRLIFVLEPFDGGHEFLL